MKQSKKERKKGYPFIFERLCVKHIANRQCLSNKADKNDILTRGMKHLELAGDPQTNQRSNKGNKGACNRD